MISRCVRRAREHGKGDEQHARGKQIQQFGTSRWDVSIAVRSQQKMNEQAQHGEQKCHRQILRSAKDSQLGGHGFDERERRAGRRSSFTTARRQRISNAQPPSAPWVAIPQGKKQREADAGVVEELEARGPLDQREVARGVFEHHRFMDHREFEVRRRIVDGDAGIFGEQDHDERDRREDRRWDR